MSGVLYCHTSAEGGAELAAPSLAKQLDLELWVRGEGRVSELAEAAGLKVKRLGARQDRRPQGVLRLARSIGQLFHIQVQMFYEVRRAAPKMIISNSVQGLLHLALPCFVAGIPLVGYVRDLGRGGNRTKAEVSIYKMLLRMCRCVIFNSQLTSDSWQVHRPALVVPTAVRKEFFDCWTSGADSALILGRISSWKGQVESMQALERANESRDVGLVLVGGSLFDEGVQLPEVSYQVISTGHVEDPWNRLSMGAFLLHSSLTPEPFGQVLAQAAAAGMPIVCSEQGGHMEWLEDGVSCLAVNPRDTTRLSEVIVGMVSDPESAHRRAATARVLAEAFREDVAYKDLADWLSAMIP